MAEADTVDSHLALLNMLVDCGVGGARNHYIFFIAFEGSELGGARGLHGRSEKEEFVVKGILQELGVLPDRLCVVQEGVIEQSFLSHS